MKQKNVMFVMFASWTMQIVVTFLLSAPQEFVALKAAEESRPKVRDDAIEIESDEWVSR